MSTLKTATICALFYLYVVSALVNGDCPRERSRTGWGAKAPKSVNYRASPPSEVIVKSTETRACNTRTSCASAVRSVQSNDMYNKGLEDISCSFVVGGDGTVYEGRGWDWATQYPDAMVLCVVGSFKSASVPGYQKDAILNFLTCAAKDAKMSSSYEVFALRDKDTKSTNPGDKLYSLVKSLPNYTGPLKAPIDNI